MEVSSSPPQPHQEVPVGHAFDAEMESARELVQLVTFDLVTDHVSSSSAQPHQKVPVGHAFDAEMESARELVQPVTFDLVTDHVSSSSAQPHQEVPVGHAFDAEMESARELVQPVTFDLVTDHVSSSSDKGEIQTKSPSAKFALPQFWRRPNSPSYLRMTYDVSRTVPKMQRKWYRAVKLGNTNFIQENMEVDIESSGHDQPAFQKSPKSNTILHFATSSGHDQLVDAILERHRKLALSKNYAGDLALHVATSAGHLPIVKKLASAELLQVKDDEGNNPLQVKNNEGNTPLHLALINKYKEVVDRNLVLKNKYREIAKFLVETEPEVSYYLNAERKSPLYMAAEAGDAVLVQLMIDKASRSEPSEGSKSIVHAAITGKSKDVLRTVWSKHPSKERDNEGMSPLSYAASIGYLYGVRYLLKKSRDCKYESDRNGFFPIHTASSKGHINVIQEFLQRCPDSIELLNNKGQNILHVAVMSGKAKVVSSMLEMPKLEMLINEKDGDGNTCLHLASEGKHPKTVSILTWDKRVDLNLLNKEGKTALDIASKNSRGIPSFQQRLTWLALKHAGAPHAPRRSTTCRENSQSLELSDAPSTHNYKYRVNTLLLVATLVATVTFAAGFTVPGGNNDSEPHKGMATFLLHHMFHIFTISNAIAMYSSLTVVVALIWAQLGDLDLVIASLKFTVPILELALTMVSLAFMTGSYLIVRDLNWLAYLVLIIGSFFLLILTILFAPLCLPNSLPHPIFRYIVYYPFCLLVIVTSSNDEEDGEEKWEMFISRPVSRPVSRESM